MSRIDSSSVKLGNSYFLNQQGEKKCPTNLTEISEEKEALTELQSCYDEIIEKAKAESSLIIQNAELKAQEIMAKAQESLVQAQESVKLAHQEALEEAQRSGYDIGYQQIYNDLNDQIKFVDMLASSTDKVKKEIICSAEKEILELTVVIAEKIIKRKLNLNPEIILNIVRAAIGELKDKEEVKVIVNPAHTTALYDFSEKFRETIKGLKTIKIIEDKTVPYDGVMVESSDSRIDARLQTQLESITKALLQEVSDSPILGESYKDINVVIDDA